MLKLAQQAEGVFLWAVVAVKFIRDGLQDTADLNQLKQGIEELPPELEDLFALMLSRIKPPCRRDAARFLQISLYHLLEHSKWGPYWTYGHTPFNLCRLYFYNIQRDVEETPLQHEQIPERELTEKCDVVRARLLSHTAGLLAINPCCRWWGEKDLFFNNDSAYDEFLRTEITFIHKTAREFLLKNEAAKAFIFKYGSTEAQIRLSIAKGLLTMVLQFPPKSTKEAHYANDRIVADITRALM